MGATREELIEADEVGGKIADAILDYFADGDNLAIIERLRRAGVSTETASRELDSEHLAGLRIVVSGRFASRSRDEMKALIRYVTSSWTEHKSVDESKELLDRLKQYIDEHLESELRRDELAEYVHLNPDYLTRLMKKQTGYSLKEYVTRRKMETARTLLRTTTLPVGFIAAKLGYNNFSHFSYTYKKIMDVTPQEERHTEEK